MRAMGLNSRGSRAEARSASTLRSFFDKSVSTIDGPHVFLGLPGIHTTLTPTAGVVTARAEIDPDGSNGFNLWPSLNNVWGEYRILGAHLRMGPVKGSSANSGEGYTAVYIDDLAPTTNPVVGDSDAHLCTLVSNSSNNEVFRERMVWLPVDIDETSWQQTSTTGALASFKFVQDPSLTGTSPSAAAVNQLIQIVYDIEVRFLLS